MNKSKRFNKWTKNFTDNNPEYINKNRNRNIREEEKNETYSKRKESQNSDEKDNSETSVDDMSSSISTASIGHILTKAFSNIQISENINKENMKNKNRIGRNRKRFKEPETSVFKGSFSFSSIKGKTVSQTMISQKSKDKTGKIKHIKYKSKSIKQKDKVGKISYVKKEAYDNNGGTGEIKKMYEKKNDDKLFKKTHKVNKSTVEKEEHSEFTNVKHKKNKSKNEEEDFDIYIWSYKERNHEPKEEDNNNINNINKSCQASKNKLKVGERKYHKKKVC